MPATYGAVAAVLAIAVLAVAFGTSGPQFSVAEFAPSAQRSIDAPPTTQGDSSSAGGRGGRRSTTTTAPPVASTDPAGMTSGGAQTSLSARTRNCVGNPPRQIEDPMSPPCVGTIFEGNNGGATARGVNETEIAVAVPSGSWCNVQTCQALVSGMFEFFNQRFELYGRRLRPAFMYGADNDAVGARALGAEIAGQNVFAAITGMAEWDLAGVSLVQELGRREVVTIMRGLHLSDRFLLDEMHPYLWSMQPSTEQWQANVGSFACASLANRPASHAGTDSLRSATRKFGIIAHGNIETPQVGTLQSAFDHCGISSSVVRLTNTGDVGTRIRTSIEQLKADGVTTLVCVCSGYTSQDIVGAFAGVKDYRPEWMRQVTWYPQQERTAGTELLDYTFGVSPDPKLLPVQAMGWHQALTTVDPKLMEAVAKDFIAAAAVRLAYEGLLILAAGIQGAGPTLTAETFAAALMSTQFSNAGSGQAPFWQPNVGFGPGDHSFYNDYSITWWSRHAPLLEPDNLWPSGSWCYVNQGARHQVGTYPTNVDGLLFRSDLPCR